MPKECEYLRVALELEHQKLLSWSEKAGYLGGHNGIARIQQAIRKDHTMLVTTLSTVRTVVDDFTDLHAFYQELNPRMSKQEQVETLQKDIAREAGSVVLSYEKGRKAREHLRGLNHLIHGAEMVKDVVTQPRRLVWAAVGKDNFQELLRKLSNLNTLLYDWMDDHVQRAILENTQSANLQMLLVRQDLYDIKSFLNATMFLNSQKSKQSDYESSSTTVVPRIELEGLARLKILNEEYLQDQSKIEGEIDLFKKNRSQLRSLDVTDKHRTNAKFFLKADAPPMEVWIEWKYYSRENYEDKNKLQFGVHPTVTARVRELVTLLHHDKPLELCTPKCLGYFDDYEANQVQERYGIIYEKPPGPGQTALQDSLFSLLTKIQMPSLTERILLTRPLTSCLLYLHAVNWIHKEFRSENISFFTDSKGNYGLRKPYISGFDHSRPDQSGTVTPASSLRFRSEMYRHPLNQGDVPQQHGCKVFDIYALGLVLLEVALWEPLEQILNLEWVDPAASTSLSEQQKSIALAAVPDRLLRTEPKHINTVEALAGEKYASIVRACLGGAESFGLQSNNTKGNLEMSGKLQMEYMIRVVDVLKDVTV